MKKRKKKITESEKIIIAVCVLAISIVYALIVNSFNVKSIDKNINKVKTVEYIYTVNTRNTIYLNNLIDEEITIYNNGLSARKAFDNKRIFLRHKVKNAIKWIVYDNENTFYFDTKKECVEASNDSQFPELSSSECKEQITRKPQESYVGFVITNEMKENNTKMIVGNHFVKCGNSYVENIEIMKKAFGDSEEELYCLDNGSDFNCSAEDLKVTVFDNGSVTAKDGNSSCTVESDGASYCN